MLPCLRPYINVWECFRTSHQVRELESKQSDQLCDNTCTRGEEQDQHSGHNNGRDEMRQVSRYLEEFFKFLCLHLVNQQSHDNRKRECYRNGVKTDDDCVFDGQTELIGVKVLFEVFQSSPAASHNAFRRCKVFKCNHNSVHRIVRKQCKNDNGRKHQ